MIYPAIRKRIGIILAIAKKEVKISFRYPKNFIAGQFLNPLRLFVMFGLIYQSFFVISGNRSIGNWSRSNYVATLFIGAIFYTGFTSAYYRFRTGFINEKYWKTIQIFLAAPISKLDYLIGTSFALAIELCIPVLTYLVFLKMAYPLSVLSLLLISTSLYLMIFGSLGFSLMHGAFSISNENYLFIFDYLYAIMLILSCFYYEYPALPSPIRFLAKANPIYHAVEIARQTIFHHLSPGQMLSSMAYLLLFASIAPLLGAFFFRKVVRELGVRGF